MIINITQHTATEDQRAAGVMDLPPPWRSQVVELLTFDTLPTTTEIRDRAETLADLACRLQSAEDRAAEGLDLPSTSFALHALIGGAPWLMAPLEDALRARGIMPVYAFSVRESVEETLPDGTVRKTAVFRHKGFVSPG